MPAMPMDHSFVTFAVQKQTGNKGKPRRAGKACLQCHARKVRCDVQRRGVPCSNCVDHSTSCFVRRRKNARLTTDSENIENLRQFDDAEETTQEPPTQTQQHQDQQQQIDHSLQDGVPDVISPSIVSHHSLTNGNQFNGVGPVPSVLSRDASSGDEWHESVTNNGNVMGAQMWNPLNGLDLSDFAGLDNSFAPADWAFITPIPPSSYGPNKFRNLQTTRNLQPQSPEELRNPIELHAGGFTTSAGLNDADRQFLIEQGCFQLPPTSILRQILRYYFQFVQPNLPLIDEQHFAPIWTEDNFNLDGFSFVVFRAMLFSAVHLLDSGDLAVLGYPGRREARLAYYRLTKLMFDFNLELDPLAGAEVCLHLTYYVPPYNTLRINAYWLASASRFARVAGADRFHLVRDRERAKRLKRTWWGVLFRDRILSLALRWTPQVDLDPTLENEEYHLGANDFSSDLGKSVIHDRTAQLQIADIISSTCKLICKLTPALHLLYDSENAEDRIRNVAGNVNSSMEEVQVCLENLQQWYHETAQKFPEPISMDDTDDSVCIFANLVFCYYSSAVFALNFHRILIHETIPESIEGISMDTCLDSSVAAINDLSKRTQELVQTRMTRYLPISVSVYMALPLLLQAINVAAVSGTDQEAVEARKLDIFSRVLKSQEENFDGSRFCTEILSAIIATARNDKRFIQWIAAWREDREHDRLVSPVEESAKHRHKSANLDWANLIRTQPKLYVHLLLQFDFAVCKGRAPDPEDSLPDLLERIETL